MIDHVTLGVGDRTVSEPLFTTLMTTLGRPQPTWSSDFGVRWRDLSLVQAGAGRVVTTGLHLGLAAPDRAAVDAFWQAGLAAGLASDGEPGPRPHYAAEYYGAFLIDPDGNSVEAVHDADVRQKACIDHVWIRARDLAATRAFYARIAGPAGLTTGIDAADHLLVRAAGGGSVSFVPATAAQAVTTPVHLAFTGPDDATVDAFHAAALHAGAVDNGAPGLRPEYHAAYYGAFVLDPDGHNVEVVNHHR